MACCLLSGLPNCEQAMTQIPFAADRAQPFTLLPHIGGLYPIQWKQTSLKQFCYQVALLSNE